MKSEDADRENVDFKLSDDSRDRRADGGKIDKVIYPDEECKQATAKAMALLLHKDRTERELSDRLYRAGFSEKSALFAIEYVRSFGYINDYRYAETYINYHKSSKSRREIRQKLAEKGISDEVLGEAITNCYAAAQEDTGGDSEEEAMQALIKKRLKGRDISELTFEEKQKQMRYLAGKGYPSEKIRRMFS